ncbi:hypothetical protein BGX27_007954 [Mortierella sp. AM989]|nr:hypothetical protein BGX27_007954 [Mortierella sp. AM989]
MSAPKRPFARSSLLVLLAFLTISLLSNSSSSLPTSRDHYSAAVDDTRAIIKKRSPDDTPTSTTLTIDSEAGDAFHHVHTPYADPNQSLGDGFVTEGETKRKFMKRGLSDDESDNLDSDAQSFMYDGEDSQERDYWENLRVEADDMDIDYEIDDDDHIVIEPFISTQDLFDDGEEDEEDAFGGGEGIVDDDSEDDQDQDDYRPWHGYSHQSRKGLGLSSSRDSDNVGTADSRQHRGDKIWIADDWEEDLEGAEDMMDELMDWVEDFEHAHVRPGGSIRDQREADTEDDYNDRSLKKRPLHRLFSNSWGF